jgi:hypothetical protein
MDPVLTSGEPERCQSAFFYPPQDGYFAYAAVFGHDPGRQVTWVRTSNIYYHFVPPKGLIMVYKCLYLLTLFTTLI